MRATAAAGIVGLWDTDRTALEAASDCWDEALGLIRELAPDGHLLDGPGALEWLREQVRRRGA